MKKLVSFDYTEVLTIRQAIEFAVECASLRALRSKGCSNNFNYNPELRKGYLSEYKKYMEMKKKFESLLVDL